MLSDYLTGTISDLEFLNIAYIKFCSVRSDYNAPFGTGSCGASVKHSFS